MAIQDDNTNVMIDRDEMTSVLANSDMTASQQSEMDMALDEMGVLPIGGLLGNTGSSIGTATEYPVVFPNNPTFMVPNNPLLPPEYREILDYNSVQYMNGILRTQIGRYVRIKYLTGSDIMEDYVGFLIGVGINYVILQNYSDNNIQILDFYGIKSVYVFYESIARPLTPETEE